MVSTAKKLDRVKDRARFMPISPSLDIDELVKNCPNFHKVERVDARTITDETMEPLRQLIQAHVIEGGKPLVLDNWHERSDWPKWIFNPDWLKMNHGSEAINVRDIPAQSDMPMTLRHYLNHLGVLASKFTPQSYSGSQQRLYAKDIDCPPAWQQSLQKILPPCTFYLSSADLMSSLPPEARAENLMCYFGHEGTYTPAHKEMCASLGQNIMVHTSTGNSPGSSIWFMTASGDRDVVAEYWLGGLGHDIEVESHFASIDSFKMAPFPVYIVEQKLGDYILVPPLAPHQVWNRGEATMKVAWNRTTPETLELAIWESLPKARLVCRDEQYKNKAIIYETLKEYYRILSKDNRGRNNDEDISREKMKADFCKLFKLFDVILLDEQFSPNTAASMKVKKIPNEFNVTCSFCRGNIFNRFLSCKRCIPPSEGDEDDDVYDVCLECYARGRSCGCISKLCWEEQHDWKTLLGDHEKFRMQVIFIEGVVSEESPQKFATSLKNFGRKSLAWVCQEQLLSRPFVDITKDPLLEDVDDAEDIKRKKKLGLLVNCHVCKVRHPDWKVAKCNGCTKAYCYGNLWRAFDIDPFDVLSDPEWKCPVCLGICSCGHCRKNGKTSPYEPRGTMLGATTKHVADPRSVQSLVDFSRGNLTWLSENLEPLKRKRTSTSIDATDNGEGSSRMFNQSPSDLYRRPFGAYGGDEDEEDADYSNRDTEIPIDPNLGNSFDEASNMRDDDYHQSDLDVGNGQYITSNDPSSVAFVERDQNRTKAQADGKVVSAATPKGTTRRVKSPAEEVKIRGKPRNNQPLLPSPKDMLTEALPPGEREALPYDINLSHLSHSSSYSSEVRSMLDKPQSKAVKGDIQSSPHQSFAHTEADDEPLWSEMSSLERNPAAFIAAAGLNMFSGISSPYPVEHTSSEVVGNQLLGVWSAAPAITFPEDPNSYSGDISQSPQRSIVSQPLALGRDPNETEGEESQTAASYPFSGETHISIQSPQAITTIAKGKRKSMGTPYGISTPTSRIIGMGGELVMTEPTQPMRDLIVGDWVKKQKLAKTNTKGRGRSKKGLVVTLKLGTEGWRKWEEKKIEPDLITKELALGGGKVQRVLVEKEESVVGRDRSASVTVSANGTGSGGIEPRKRPRGRPRKNATPMVMDLDSDDEGEDEEEEVIPEPKSRRRESAWMARKREEEAKVDAERAIENEERAREKAIEDEQQRIIQEQQRIIDEKEAIEEERRRKEEERLQAIEDEKVRKEAERRRAYQEAKIMAARIAEGQIDGVWDYDSDEQGEGDHHMGDQEGWMPAEEVGMLGERRECWWESELPQSSFAVVMDRQPGYHWKSQYITEAELALKTGEQDKPTAATTPPPRTEAQETQTPAAKTWGVSRPTPTHSQRNPTVEPAMTTDITQSQESIDVGYVLTSGDEHTARKWLPRRKHIQEGAEMDKPAESTKISSGGRNVTKNYLDGDEIGEFEDTEMAIKYEKSDMEEDSDIWKGSAARKWMY